MESFQNQQGINWVKVINPSTGEVYYTSEDGIVTLRNTVVSNAVTASYALSGGSGGFNITASYVNPLRQNVTIGNITSTPSTENTLNIYPPQAGGTGEGGQILLAASGGLYTSASMLDNWQNTFRILKGTNTGGSTVSYFNIDLNNGNLTTAGTITPGVWNAGDVIQMRAYKPGDAGVYAVGTAATSTSNSTFFSCSFTPKSTTSYIVAEISAKYEIAGGGNDSFFSTLTVNGPAGTEIGFSYQILSSTAGSDRTGVLFPLSGRYTNSSTSTISVCANVRRGTADDNVNFDYTNANSITMVITEIGR
jgi:hypothetical protein